MSGRLHDEPLGEAERKRPSLASKGRNGWSALALTAKRTSLGRVHPVVVHVPGRRGIQTRFSFYLSGCFFKKKLKLLISKKT